LIASLGSSFSFGLLPSFSEAHKGAYEDCQPCYISAGIFNFLVSVAQQITGLFFMGIPHNVHNFMVGLNFTIAFSIGLFAFCLIPNKKFKGVKKHGRNRT